MRNKAKRLFFPIIGAFFFLFFIKTTSPSASNFESLKTIPPNQKAAGDQCIVSKWF
jgi:hypothetical protein